MPSGKIANVKAQAKVTTKRPKPPDHLSDIAKAEYLNLVKVLDDTGKLAATDSKLIEMYAFNYDLARKLTLELGQCQSYATTAQGGRRFIEPLLKAIHDANRNLKDIINDLGLSPKQLVKQDTGNRPSLDEVSRYDGLIG
jgi:P27 family predicted phage terminase small subunit